MDTLKMGAGVGVFEDEESKIRRNVVAVGAAILLFAWLNVSPGSVAKRIFGDTDNFELSPARFWSAVMALLFYLALRFQYCDEFESHIKAFKNALFTAQQGVRTRFLASVLARFALTGEDSPIFANTLKGVLNAIASERYGQRNVGWKEGWGIRNVNVVPSGWRGGEIHWNFFQSSDDGSDAFLGRECVLGYVLTWPQETKIRLRGYVRVLVFSRSSVNVLWPCAICLAAAFVVAWNIGTALFPRVVAVL
jgi:hypothetical protein